METYIFGVVLKLNGRNAGGTVYNKDCVLAAVEAFNKKPTKLSEFLPLDRTVSINLEYVGGLITQLYTEGDYLCAEIKVIDTMRGLYVKENMNSFEMMFSIKSTGTLSPDNMFMMDEIISVDLIPFNGEEYVKLAHFEIRES